MAEQKTKEIKKNSAEYWKVELTSATERQKDFWKRGSRIDDRFKDSRKDKQKGTDNDLSFRLNLFHANVDTQMSMLYGRVPKTDVSRRYADPNDDVARVSSELLQRQLNTAIEAPGSTDQDILRCCLQDRLLPGLGVARIRYEFEATKEVEKSEVLGEDGTVSIVESEVEQITDEYAPIEYVHWRDFRWGYSRTWADVPWISFDIYLNKEDFEKRFGKKYADKVEFEKRNEKNRDDENKEPEKDAPWLETKVVEIWCKSSKKVYWYSDNMGKLLDTKDDPLDLHGFFPCPEPMAANITTSLYLPTADFILAQDLYNYIDKLQTRISIITEAVKVVGVYDSGSEEIKRMFQEGTDNDLIPVSNWAMFAEKEGLKGQIDWLPLEQIVNALAKLQELRNDAINLLYQITGMSDILRGHSEQYSGVGQEVIKAKFASARMQRTEDEFAKFASNLMRLRAEVITKHFEPRTIFKKSAAKYMMEDQELVLKSLQLLKSDDEDWMWQIEIKPENIAMVDYAQIKAERTEFLSAMSTFISSAEGVGAGMPEIIPFLLEMMKWGMAGFKGSQQIEGVLDKAVDAIMQKLKNPEPPKPNEKVQEIQMKHQSEMEKLQAKSNAEMMKLFEQHKANMTEMITDQQGNVDIEQVQMYMNSLEQNLKHMQDMELERLRQRGKDNVERSNDNS